MELEGRRVLVTGGSGFLGRALLPRLKREGAVVMAPTRDNYDLVEPPQARRAVRDTRPDLVFHLAAVVGGIGANRKHPGQFFYKNAMMGLELIEAARLEGVKKVVVVGTICAYPKFTEIPFREETLWDGYPEETNAPYGLAKKMMLVQLQAYREEFGLNGVYLLPVNMYGPQDNFDPETSHVIPALIRKFVEAQERGEGAIVCWGDGSPTREFLYVEDAAEGLILAATRYDDAQPVNLGTGKEISIKDLTGLIAEVVGFDGVIRWDPSRPNGQPRRSLDVSRSEAAFGFRASTSLREGLEKTVAWFRQSRDVIREVQFESVKQSRD